MVSLQLGMMDNIRHFSHNYDHKPWSESFKVEVSHFMFSTSVSLFLVLYSDITCRLTFSIIDVIVVYFLVVPPSVFCVFYFLA